MLFDPYRRTLDCFEIGDVIKHWPRKTITESDNNLFCLLTLNHHPLHSDVQYAHNSQHGKIVVVGTYVLSLVVGMTVPDVSGAAIANLEYESVIHNGPVFIGDTIHAETEIIDIVPSKKNSGRGVLYVETRAFNQDEKRVLTFRRKVLLPYKIK